MNDRIALLDDITANKIAAGEVVERPASVVKELLENAIDADCSEIKIEIEDGGKQLVRISDNGIGMSRNDALMCLQRHATSKIIEASDLEAIKTLGFRGEAIPSIASVSNMLIETCDNINNDGTLVNVLGGEVTRVENIAFSKGTRISVANIFYNTPARLKFLKTTANELSHINNIVSQYAICYPQIRFELLNNGKQMLLSSSNGHMLNALTSVLGLDTAKNMISFEESDGIVRVYGYVSKLDAAKGSRRDQYFFVNGRPIKNKSLLHATETPIKNMVGSNKYPVCVVFVDLPPNLIDVNVHPAKTEIKFSNERQIYSLIYKAVSKAITEKGGVHSISIAENTIYSSEKPSIDSSWDNKIENKFDNKSNMSSKSYSNSSVSNDITDFSNSLNSVRSNNTDLSDYDPFDWKSQGVPIDESPIDDMVIEKTAVELKDVSVIAQHENTYIVCSCADGILLIDQHVAHERVLYERMLKNSKDENYIQYLLIPEPITLSVRDSAILSARMEEMKTVGYDLEIFGVNSYIIRGHPSSVPQDKAKKILEEMISEVAEISNTRHLLVKPEQMLITASCKMAIKAGEKLSKIEMEHLVKDLLLTNNPFTCPHNRPIIISISNWEIAKKFKRI